MSDPDLEPPAPDDSVAPYLTKLKAGDRDAADVLFGKYFERVVRVAQRRLEGRKQRAAEAEDVAADAFESLWRMALAGSFGRDDLADRNGLWRLLCCIVRRKAEDHARHENAAKRGGGGVRGDSVFADDDVPGQGFDSLRGGGFTPAELAAFADGHRRLLEVLHDDLLAEIVTMRLEGRGLQEIADRFNRSVRWSKRKLALIREIWQKEIGREPEG